MILLLFIFVLGLAINVLLISGVEIVLRFLKFIDALLAIEKQGLGIWDLGAFAEPYITCNLITHIFGVCKLLIS